ncbi:MAG: septum formation initiator family protein [Jiangellaceae bacterium]
MSPAAAIGSAARRLLPAGSARSNLRMVPPRVARSPRAPFVALVLLLLGLGLVGLLLLNTALQQGSFELADLERETAVLRDRRAELADEVASRSAPDALARSARSLGMVQGEEPVFLHLEPGDAG